MKNEEYKKLSIKEFTKAAGRYESSHAGIYEMCKKDYPDILEEFKDFRNLIIEFDRNNTYIQSEGINQDFGVYDCPDELLKEHHQEISAFKAFAYRHIGRHLMNRNVRKIRER